MQKKIAQIIACKKVKTLYALRALLKSAIAVESILKSAEFIPRSVVLPRIIAQYATAINSP